MKRMKTSGTIHNLDQLEKELFRLRLEARDQEKKIVDNIDHFRGHAGPILRNSFFCKRSGAAGTTKKEGGLFFKSERLNALMNRISDRVTDRAVDGMGNLIDRIFGKRKKTRL